MITGLTYEQKVEAINAEWRAERTAPLTECQASHKDGECYHFKCPNKGQNRKCPLDSSSIYWGDDGDLDELE